MTDEQLDRQLTALLNEEAGDITSAPTASEMTLRVARRVSGGRTASRTTSPLRLVLSMALSLSLLLVALMVAAVVTGQRTSVPPAPAGRIVFSHAAAGAEQYVYTMAADGSDPVRLGSSPSMVGVPSPDGSRVAVTQQQADGRWTSTVMGPDGSDPVSLPPPDDSDLNLSPVAWSPDGAQLALEGWSDADRTRNGIYTATPAGEDLSPLLTTMVPDGHAVPVAWSPDGTSLLFLQLPDDGDQGELYVLDGDSTQPRRLSAEGQHVWLNGFNVAGSWSPDSGSVAYTASDATGSAAFVVPASGGEPVQISDLGNYPTGARFSPDGAWVLFDIAAPGAGVPRAVARPSGRHGRPSHHRPGHDRHRQLLRCLVPRWPAHPVPDRGRLGCPAVDRRQRRHGCAPGDDGPGRVQQLLVGTDGTLTGHAEPSDR